MLFAVDVIRPNVLDPSAPSGTEKLGVLVTLKHSTRSCSLAAPTATSLNRDMSIRRCGGPYRLLRPELPMVSIVWPAKLELTGLDRQ